MTEEVKITEKAEAQDKLKVYDSSGKETGEVGTIFAKYVNQAVLTEAVNMYLANKRKGLASTKTRGEVSGGGKKPWKQKGTGRARVGSSRNPLWRHGGVVFGPHPKGFAYSLGAKVRAIALQSAFNVKNSEDGIIILDSLRLEDVKTKNVKKILDSLKIKGKVLIITDKNIENLKKASGNIPYVKIAFAHSVNAHDVLNTVKVIILKDALGIIKGRFGK